MADDNLRAHFGDLLTKAEVVIYSVLAALLFITALVSSISAAQTLWQGVRQWTLSVETLRVLDDLLVVLMLVEVLHTVNISIRSHVLVTEPFLVVGLIASIRRILVITLQAASLTQSGAWSTTTEALFRESMIELALLGILVLILVVSIVMLRKSERPENQVEAK